MRCLATTLVPTAADRRNSTAAALTAALTADRRAGSGLTTSASSAAGPSAAGPAVGCLTPTTVDVLPRRCRCMSDRVPTGHRHRGLPTLAG